LINGTDFTTMPTTLVASYKPQPRSEPDQQQNVSGEL